MDKKIINWSILIALAITWGSSFILMKRGMDVFSSDEVAALRIFIAFLFIIPFLYKHVKKSLLKHWKGFLGMGLFGNLIPAFLFTKAETGISSSLTGMLNSLTPLFTLILGVILFGVKTKWINIIGILLGFMGAVGLLLVGKSEAVSNNIFFGLYVVLGTFCYALSLNIIKKELNEISPITATVWAMMLIGPFAGFYLLGFTDFTSKLSHPLAYESLGYIIVLGILGTTLSVMIFTVLIRNTNPLFASSVTYLIPIVALIWGVLDGEDVQLLHFVWILLILMGVNLVTKKTGIKPLLDDKEPDSEEIK